MPGRKTGIPKSPRAIAKWVYQWRRRQREDGEYTRRTIPGRPPAELASGRTNKPAYMQGTRAANPEILAEAIEFQPAQGTETEQRSPGPRSPTGHPMQMDAGVYQSGGDRLRYR